MQNMQRDSSSVKKLCCLVDNRFRTRDRQYTFQNQLFDFKEYEGQHRYEISSNNLKNEGLYLGR